MDTNRGCSAGIGISELSSVFVKSNLTKDKKLSSGISFDYFRDFDFQNRSYWLKGAGKLWVHKQSTSNVEVRFTLWRAEDDEANGVADENMTEEKIILQ